MLGSLIGIIIFFLVVRYLVKFLYRVALRRASRPVMHVSINYPADMYPQANSTEPHNRNGASRNAFREPVRFDEPILFPHKEAADLDKPDESLAEFFYDFDSDSRRN
ncbi:hypothetical protein ACWDTP_34030 [Mycobacterium sp. NPDC003449]